MIKKHLFIRVGLSVPSFTAPALAPLHGDPVKAPARAALTAQEGKIPLVHNFATGGPFAFPAFAAELELH